MDGPIIKDNTITIPSDQDYLVAVDDFLEGTLRGFGVDESTIADIAISVTEVVNNGIIHGNKCDPSKALTLQIARSGSTLKFVVSDEGEGFDPSCVDDPLKEENLLKEVGRGIFIIRSLMDKVEFENTPEGVRVTMTKTV
ncbi:MAG: ATP-binding protein [candidate division Zixibacteria bacterium]|nr:ATP-binding protein [candidate division Zixibacteria bacterium]